MIQPIKNKLSIFYYNDVHGNSDQMSGLVTASQKFKQENRDSFILSAGDNYSGADNDKNGFVLNLMKNLMGVEASAVGNHELDGTSDGFFSSTNGKNIDFIATNVKLGSNNLMQKSVKKSVIKEKNGVKYGFVGAMPIDFDKVSKKENQKDIKVMPFEDSVKAIQSEIDKLKEQGIDKIIMLSHSGYDVDKKYAKSLDGVDIIVGGHSHTVVEGIKSNENSIKSKSGEPVLIVQAGENGKHYGILNVEFTDGIISSAENNLKRSANTNKSPVIEYIKDQTLGKSPKVATVSKIDSMPKNRRIEPCAWTNLVADSMKAHFKTDIAVINAANIRKVPQAGTLTERDIAESAPMKNDLLVTKITEKQLVDAIKMASKRTMTNAEGYPGLLMVSGLSYKIDKNGELLELNRVEDETKTPIDINNPSNKVYTACYDVFVARKDGEYPEMFPQFPVERYKYDKDTTAIEYLKGKENLEVVNDERIKIVTPFLSLTKNR